MMAIADNSSRLGVCNVIKYSDRFATWLCFWVFCETFTIDSCWRYEIGSLVYVKFIYGLIRLVNR